MSELYAFYPQLVLRTTAEPFTTVFDAQTIRRKLDDPRFMEAVYLASPVLHEECRKWRGGELTDERRQQRLLLSLTRYYARSVSRCTPFGLFAGCSVVQWGHTSEVRVAPARSSRHTRLDMHYLCSLAQTLATHDAIRPQLRYFPNTSLYALGQELRYIEYQYEQGNRVHQISAVEASAHLQHLLQEAQAGRLHAELVALLAEDEADRPEAALFVDALIQAQILVPELEPNVTGEEFLTRIQRVLSRLTDTPAAEIAPMVSSLADVRRHLAALDGRHVNSAADYERIIAALMPLGVPIEAGKLFQTDATTGVDPTAATVTAAVQEHLHDALRLLAQLTPAAQNPRLDDFRTRFQARYEEREIPLLEILDNESGLSYTDYGKNGYAPLVSDLAVAGAAAQEKAPHLTGAQKRLYEKLRVAERTAQYTIEITEEDFREFPAPAQLLPPSLAVMFRFIGAGQLLLESVGGSSAVNLLGRFAHANAAIEQLVRDVALREQEHNPDVAFAEICHLPASRVGNVLLRPSFRALEIPYLAQSALPPEGQVLVQDLLLSVRNGQLVLRSRKTNQRIIPRLSTAHNFSGESLPVYQFLCDLQTQGVSSYLGFDWQMVTAHGTFFPRVTYRQVVLTPASWKFRQADVVGLLNAPAVDVARCFQVFRRQWQLPQLFTLADGDNELLVDADNALLVQVWLDTIRGRDGFTLKEFLLDPASSPVRDAAGRPYAHQFVALLVRQGPCYTAPAPPRALPVAVPREFLPGSEWLYYKLYCGQKTASRVLLDCIGPLTRQLRELGLIDTWFFIRYADPDNHLRVRVHLPAPGRLGEVLPLLEAMLAPFVAGGTVWKVQLDTYRRELERYGTRTIGLSEALFGYQSTQALALLTGQVEEPHHATADWLWGLGAMDELLTAFVYSLPQRIALLQELKEAFAREFAADKALRAQLAARYRAARPDIQRLLDAREGTMPPVELLDIARQIGRLEAQGELEVAKDQLLAAYLHMLLNRIIPVEARLHELVLYDFLLQYYQSRQAVQKRQ